jgi:hypothetical protein
MISNSIGFKKFVTLIATESEKFTSLERDAFCPKVPLITLVFLTILLEKELASYNYYKDDFTISDRCLQERDEVEKLLSERAAITKLEAEMPYDALVRIMCEDE